MEQSSAEYVRAILHRDNAPAHIRPCATVQIFERFAPLIERKKFLMHVVKSLDHRFRKIMGTTFKSCKVVLLYGKSMFCVLRRVSIARYAERCTSYEMTYSSVRLCQNDSCYDHAVLPDDSAMTSFLVVNFNSNFKRARPEKGHQMRVGYRRNLQFSAIKSPYLRNGARQDRTKVTIIK